MEEEEGRGRGLWIILFILAFIAAIVFATLWYLRGGDIVRLNNAITANQSAADAAATRLERELRNSRNEVDTGARTIADLEKRVSDEQRRSTEMSQSVERRMRMEVDSANSRVRDLNTRLMEMEKELALAKSMTPATGALGLVSSTPTPESASTETADELEQLKQQLADVTKERDELSGLVGDLKANVSHIGQELTSANEDSRRLDDVRKELNTARETIKTLETKTGDLEANNSHLRNELKSSQDELSGLAKKNAELESGHGSLRKELAAAGTAVAAAGLAAGKIKDLENKLAESNGTIEDLRSRAKSYEAEQEKLRKELSDVSLNLQQAQSEAVRNDLVQGELEAARKTIDGLNSQIANLEEHRTNLRNDLTSREKELLGRIEKLEKDNEAVRREAEEARRKADEEREARKAEFSKEMNEAIAKLEARAEQPGGAEAIVSGGGETESLRKRLDDMTHNADKLRSDNEQALARIGRELDAAKQAAVDLETKLAAVRKDNADLGERLNTALDNLRDARREAVKNLAAVKQDYDERVAKERVRSEDREKELRAAFEREKASWKCPEPEAAKPEEKDSGEQEPETAKATEGRDDGAEKAEASVPPAVPALSETPGAGAFLSSPPMLTVDPTQPGGVVDLPVEPVHYYVQDPDRFVGAINDMAVGGGYVVNVGSRQGVRPGMLFDVHRPLGGMHWYLGVLRVDRTMGYSSEASLLTPAEVKICPVTGRAVLDPGMRHSPYVFADGGKPVPLISAASLGLGGELPAIGDRIDNPYYDPSRPLTFAFADGVAEGEPLAVRAVEGLGGKIGDDVESADFEVVDKYDPENSTAKPRRITPGQVESYVDSSVLSGM